MDNKEKDFFSDLKSGVKELGKQMGKVMGEVFNPDLSADLSIKMDMYYTADQFVIEMELAGVPKAKVNIQIVEQMLIIKGEKMPQAQVKEEDYVKRSRQFGTFHKNIDLPQDVEIEKIKAKFEDGLLLIRFPRILPTTSEPETEEDTLNIQID
ncbi:MAG: Hsp20/alpha crystallin family protein [Bacteroidia bacterium]